MKNRIFYLALAFCINHMRGQKVDSSIIYFDQGVKALREGDYRKADTLFTVSIRKKPHPDAFYNRASARQKLGNKVGYCEDLCYAAVLGDKEAKTLFCKRCGRVDTNYTDVNNHPTTAKRYISKYVNYRSDFKNANISVEYGLNNNFISAIYVDNKFGSPMNEKVRFADSFYFNTESAVIFSIVDEMAEFPGGLNAMAEYLKDNTQIPGHARQEHIEGICFTRFMVNEIGEISDIDVLKGVRGCAECDGEAFRVIKAMPKWKPAKANGKNVKSYYNLPVHFKISNR